MKDTAKGDVMNDLGRIGSKLISICKHSIGALVVALAMLMTLVPSQAYAASGLRCYTIAAANTPVYSTSGLGTKIGAIYASDEVIVNTFSSSKVAVNVTYPISGGRTKTGWIRTSAILTATAGYAHNSTRRYTTYRRPGGASYGSVYVGDQVVVLGAKSGYTQIRYPVAGGYKFAWARTTDVNAGKTSSSSNNTTSSSGYANPVRYSSARWSTSRENGCQHDIQKVPAGTPVYAIADGTITCQQKYTISGNTKYLVSYGNVIYFTSKDGRTKATYAHLNSFSKCTLSIPSYRTKQLSASRCTVRTITRGTYSVRKGELIGYVGTTGNSTGAHLHFELRINGTRVNPPAYVKIN